MVTNLINHDDSSTTPNFEYKFQYKYTISFMYDIITDALTLHHCMSYIARRIEYLSKYLTMPGKSAYFGSAILLAIRSLLQSYKHRRPKRLQIPTVKSSA